VKKSLIDTDIYSEILKAVDRTVRASAIAYRNAHGVLTISAVTMMEIARGHQQKQASRQLKDFLSVVGFEEVLPFDRGCAELAGRIGGELERTGRPVGLADTMIAAIALAHGLELVTGNTTHFQRVQHLGYPLTLANWRV
jgi:tRNA(fMet)-specific endonuclease VapC